MAFNLIQLELGLLALALVVFMADLLGWGGEGRRKLGVIAALGLAALLLWAFIKPGTGSSTGFSGMLLSDGLARVFRVVLLGSALLTTLMSLDFVKKSGLAWPGEYYFLLLMATLALCLVVASGDLLSLYVALELNAICAYVLVSILKGKSLVSTEGGLKYLVLGALSSAILLYGVSILYGLSGTTSIAGLGTWAATAAVTPLLLMAGAMVLAGLAFKIALVPFHAWSPDVYQAAPTPITAFLSVASKAAGFVALIRVFQTALPSLQPHTAKFLTLLAILTYILANVVALRQVDFKRLMAYSSISQAGYLLLGLLANSTVGTQSLIYFMIVYLFTNMAAFFVATQVSMATGDESIVGLRGLHKRSPGLALGMMLAMFSLAGIPPLGGFFGKFYLFFAGVKAGYVGLVFFAVVMSIISLFYYLVVIKRMYLEDPEPGQGAISWGLPARVGLGLCVVGILLTGVWPKLVLDWIKAILT